jgi:hypothetical protein
MAQVHPVWTMWVEVYSLSMYQLCDGANPKLVISDWLWEVLQRLPSLKWISVSNEKSNGYQRTPAYPKQFRCSSPTVYSPTTPPADESKPPDVLPGAST